MSDPFAQSAPSNDPFGGAAQNNNSNPFGGGGQQPQQNNGGDPFGGNQQPQQNNGGDPFGGNQQPQQNNGGDPFGGNQQPSSPFGNSQQSQDNNSLSQPNPASIDTNNPFGVPLVRNQGGSSFDYAKDGQGNPIKFMDVANNRYVLGKELNFESYTAPSGDTTTSVTGTFLIVDPNTKENHELKLRVFPKALVDKMNRSIQNDAPLWIGLVTHSTSKQSGRAYADALDIPAEDMNSLAQIAHATGFWDPNNQ